MICTSLVYLCLAGLVPETDYLNFFDDSNIKHNYSIVVNPLLKKQIAQRLYALSVYKTDDELSMINLLESDNNRHQIFLEPNIYPNSTYAIVACILPHNFTNKEAFAANCMDDLENNFVSYLTMDALTFTYAETLVAIVRAMSIRYRSKPFYNPTFLDADVDVTPTFTLHDQAMPEYNNIYQKQSKSFFGAR